MAKTIDDGVYDVRSMIAPEKFALDAQNQGTCEGTNVGIWEPLHQNNQRWQFTYVDGKGYRVQCVNGGMCVDAVGAGGGEGDIQLYLWNGGSNQCWDVEPTGETTTIDGETCKVVKVYGYSEKSLCWDKEGGVNSPNSNVGIYYAKSSDDVNQKWALVPAKKAANIPAPTILAPSRTSWKDDATEPLPAGSLCLRWYSPTTITFARMRHEDYKNGSWGGSTAYGAWDAYRLGTTEGMHTSRDDVGLKVWSPAIDFGLTYPVCMRKYTVQMRSTASATEESVSPTATSTFTVYKKPTVKFTNVTTTAEGLRLGVSNDFAEYGTTYYKFSHATGVDTSKLGTLNDSKGYVLIPNSKLMRVPGNGSTFTLEYRVSIADGLYFDTQTDTVTVTAEGGTVDVTPTITEDTGATKKAVVKYANKVRMWMVYDGYKTELTGTVANGKTTFPVIYPFGIEYQLLTWYESTSSTDWGCDVTDMPATNARIHAWDWDGGALALWLDTDTLKESRDYSLVTDSHTLAGRSKPEVSILSDHDGNSHMEVTSTVTGALLPDDKYHCTTADVEALLKAGHARYRSPFGRIVQVAVTGASVETIHSYSQVSIDQTEVG